MEKECLLPIEIGKGYCYNRQKSGIPYPSDDKKEETGLTCCEPEPAEKMPCHFLFHIFRMDKAETPMPKNKAAELFQLLKSNFVHITANKEKL